MTGLSVAHTYKPSRRLTPRTRIGTKENVRLLSTEMPQHPDVAKIPSDHAEVLKRIGEKALAKKQYRGQRPGQRPSSLKAAFRDLK